MLEEQEKAEKPQKKEKKKDNFIFLTSFQSEEKNYQKGDTIFIENENVIEYLTAKKIIKKWQL